MTAIVQWRSAECDNCMDIKPCRRVNLGDDFTAELCAECEPVPLEDLQQALDTWSEGVRYTREHYVTDPRQFVGRTPVPVFVAIEDTLRHALPVLLRVLTEERHGPQESGSEVER